MTDDQALALAARALADWGGAAEAPRIVKNRENIVLDARLADGRRVALRLHRPGYQTEAAIASELLWTEALGAAGLPVALPVRTADGALLAVHERVASCVGWLAGTPIGAAEVPLAGGPQDQRRLMRDLGALIARVHDATDAFVPGPGFERPRWDIDAWTGPAPLWGPYWENPALDAAERDVLAEGRAAARAQLQAHRAAGGDFGLIHADVLRENVLSDGGRLALIDFDDCGFGFRMYDLATAVNQGVGEAGLAGQVAALIEGYGAVRALPEDAESLLALFMALRSFASAGWTIGRFAPDHPIQARYGMRAVAAARRLLDGELPW